MIKSTAIVALIFPAMLLRAGDSGNYAEPCTFKGHTAVGIVSGACATLQLPLPGYHYRWTLTLEFDAASVALASRLEPDQFADMVRTQSAADGSDIIVLPLWGDLEVTPTDPDYQDQIKTAAPLYETRPNLITITRTSDGPFTLVILFEEPDDYLNLDTRVPSPVWWGKYIESYYRLGTNRATGFSGNDGTQGNRGARRGPNPRRKN